MSPCLGPIPLPFAPALLPLAVPLARAPATFAVLLLLQWRRKGEQQRFEPSFER